MKQNAISLRFFLFSPSGARFRFSPKKIRSWVFSFNDLLIDDTPHNAMNASNNSTRPNESSAEDELDDEEGEDEKKPNGTDVNNKTLLVSLLKQINMLHETNSKIFRNLHETKGKWVL